MIRPTALLAIELVGLIIGVTFLVQLGQRRLGPDRIRDVMGGRPVIAAVKGIGVGFATPFCTYSAIPMLLGMRQARVPTAGFVAFIAAAPVLDPILFGALSLIIGVEAALLYMLIAFVGALTLALVAESVGIDAQLKPIADRLPVSVGRDATPAADVTVPGATASCETALGGWRGLRAEIVPAWSAAVALLRTMLPLLVLGLAVGLAIEGFVDAETAARITGENEQLAIPIAAALGTPLYVSTELFVPIADSLEAAGVSTGAIVALTIAGAGANVPEFILLGRFANRRLIGFFFTYVFTIAVVGGVTSTILL